MGTSRAKARSKRRSVGLLLALVVPALLPSCCYSTGIGPHDGGSSSASGSTGSSGGVPGDAGCLEAWNPSLSSCDGVQELTSCSQDSDCGVVVRDGGTCLFTTCIDDPNMGGSVCEYSCATTADCPSLNTICRNGSCTQNLCGPGTTNGTLFGTCTAVCNGDGTCNVSGLPDGGLLGVCYQAGAGICGSAEVCSDAGCTVNNSLTQMSRATPPNLLCPPGTACLVNAGVPECPTRCDYYLATPACPVGKHCQLEYPPEPPYFVPQGICE